jgi:MoxR-like ATPase
MTARLADPFAIYTGVPGAVASDVNARLEKARRPIPDEPKGYIADEGLVAAANVALRLGQPLLLTGEPGAGKSRFADSLAAELDLGGLLRFSTKSTSTAADVLYTFDALRRYHDAQLGASGNNLKYVTYHALGLAILRSLSGAEVEKWIGTAAHAGPKRSVVLIDEVDKAPRDFPNDVLNEIERLEFGVPELSEDRIRADPKFAPIIVLTSNSERALPDPFLRRCVYYNIPPPSTERLKQIVDSRIRDQVASRPDLLRDAFELYEMFRARSVALRKRPATAELLGWLSTLNAYAASLGVDNPLHGQPDQVRKAFNTTSGALIKTADDQQAALGILEKWVAKISTPTKTSSAPTGSV